ncbi:MAG: BMP family protein [Chloroflexi bacterium]|nr:BMP family protein [Chloroflexota bacterium]
MFASTRLNRWLVRIPLALGLLLAACAPAATPAPTAAPTAEPFKVALIVTSTLADGSWNQFQYESMKEIEKTPGVKVSYSENVAIPDFERVAGDYCRQGYDLIIAHTFDYQEPALKVAKTCPKTKFAVTGGWMFDTNVAGLGVWPCEGGYLAGVLGGLMTKTNKVGLIGGFNSAPTQVCFHEAFKQGVKSANANADIVETWTGTWYDVAIGYEAANAQIDNGVDFIAISLSGPGFGAIDAAKDHNAKGASKVYVVGAFVDMNSRAPDTVISSTIWLTTQPTLKLIDIIRQGKFEGKSYDFFMADGSTDLAPYHQLDSVVPQDVKDKVATARQDIVSGKLKVPIVMKAPG